MTETQIANISLLRIGNSKQITSIDAVTDLSLERVTASAIFDNARDYVLGDFPWPFATKYATLGLIGGSSEIPANNDWMFGYRYPSDALMVRRLVTIRGRQDLTPPPFRIGRDFLLENDSDISDITMALTTAGTWVAGQTITITASDDYFDEDNDVGNQIVITSGANTVTITITAYVSETVVRGTSTIDVPAALRTGSYSTWSKAYDGRCIFTNEEEAVAEYTVGITDAAEFDAVFVSLLAWKLGAIMSLSLSRTTKMAEYCLSMYELEKSRATAKSMNEGQQDQMRDASWISGR